METTKVRIRWIDYAKLIGIFVVLFAHTGKLSADWLVFVNSFTMPFFFFLSGMTQKEDSLSKTVKTGFRTLIIPYVCLYLVTLVINMLLMSLTRFSLIFSAQFFPYLGKLIIGMFYGIGHDTKISYMHNPPLWYLTSLFSTKIIFSLINHFAKNYRYICQCVFAVIFAVVAIIFHPDMAFIVPFGIGPAFMCYAFFICGFLTFHHVPAMKEFLENKEKSFIIIKVILFAVCIVLTVLLNKVNGVVEVNGMGFGKIPVLFYINALPGILMMILFATFVKLPKKTDIFSQNTLIIFAFGNPITFSILFVLKHISKYFYGEVPIVIPLILAFATLLLCYIPIKIILLWFPWMLGKKLPSKQSDKITDNSNDNTLEEKK